MTATRYVPSPALLQGLKFAQVPAEHGTQVWRRGAPIGQEAVRITPYSVALIHETHKGAEVTLQRIHVESDDEFRDLLRFIGW